MPNGWLFEKDNKLKFGGTDYQESRQREGQRGERRGNASGNPQVKGKNQAIWIHSLLLHPSKSSIRWFPDKPTNSLNIANPFIPISGGMLCKPWCGHLKLPQLGYTSPISLNSKLKSVILVTEDSI